MELLFEFLTAGLNLDREQRLPALWRDYQRGGRRDQPAFLKDFLAAETGPSCSPPKHSRPWFCPSARRDTWPINLNKRSDSFSM
jgi:hypothetical protein